ncbi:hypothetical protein [Nocardiopsis synnemataformans]|uniref:hypothetical protein n=1 Tax=Nocardiopsis synnemataformans TaxID=61305 RepID=UPI003EBC9731
MTDSGWNIRTDPDNPYRILLRRPWDSEDHVVSADKEAEFRALERMEADYPGWVLGWQQPDQNHKHGYWAQYPGETLVQGEGLGELRQAIIDARIRLGL